MRLNRSMRLLPVLAALLLPATLFGAAPPEPAAPPGQAWLTGQLLIAAPGMTDPRFHRTVLVMVRHNRDGAMAIVINRPLGAQPMARILEALGEKAPGVTTTVPVYFGGPVQLDMSTVLHSAEYRRNGTLDIDGRVAVTASMEIYRDIAANTGPQKSIVVFGYAGWAPNQLEGEMAQNVWFTAPMDVKLVFDADRDKVWDLAMERRTRDL
jgi:putative transcriptional regulator